MNSLSSCLEPCYLIKRNAYVGGCIDCLGRVFFHLQNHRGIGPPQGAADDGGGIRRNPELCRERGGSFRMEILRDVYGVLRPCGFIVGLGIGFLVSWLIMPENEDAYGEHAEMVVFALLCICGGLGMLGAFFAERWLRRRDRVSAGAGDAR